MKVYIALFRGINVGGKNILPMKNLIGLFNDMGFTNVKTYIQSGNLVFSGNEQDPQQLSDRIRSSIKNRYHLEPRVQILNIEEFEKAIQNNPFPESESNPKSLHLGFLSEEPKNPDLNKLEEIRKESERFRLIGKVFYLIAPEGVGRSKLAAGSERLLDVSMTDRNWRTVCKIRDMVNEIKMG